MLIAIVAYFGGLLTILSPCVLPVLPLVFAGADRPFRSGALPMLLGMALAFTAVASLATFAGGWAIRLNELGRAISLALFATFGLAMLLPSFAERLSRPLVSLGQRLTTWADAPGRRFPLLQPVLLGVGCGFLWAPCAGPILGLILTSAALEGASMTSSLLLLAFAVGAATSLACALWLGQQLASFMRLSLRAADWIRRASGVAILLAVTAIALGIDTGLLTRLSITTTAALEQAVIHALDSNIDRAVAPAAAQPLASTMTPMADSGDFPSLSGAGEWINSSPLTPDSLRGKVVLVDFWTYSCINCLRTLPYLRAWSERYKSAGLVVVGIHTPEFSFEKQSRNVHRAVGDLKIDYPVAIDNDFAIWRAFGNRYWPAMYFIDAHGKLRHHQFGEGAYEESERVIQQLLAEIGPVSAHRPLDFVQVTGTGTTAAPGLVAPQSEETYLGYGQARGFASPGGVTRDRVKEYTVPDRLMTDQWSLSGLWTVEPERIMLAQSGGRIAYRFMARDLHLVLGPGSDGKPVRFRVRLDGKPPGADHGFDTDAEGNGQIDAQRLYQLIRQRGVVQSHLFEIEFDAPGVEAYVFTFG